MSAAPTSTMGHHQYIPLAKLTPSPLNHRKHFDKVKMDELADSIRVQGVVVPIVARPLNGGDGFEIVAGERRFRAAKAAGLIDIPAIVRELDDAQALELQVIENGQRVDVHPLEEAEGYEALLQCRQGGDAYTVERIAEKVGKKKGTVYARLKLLALTKEARAAFYDGRLDSSRALLLARIPNDELQVKAMAEILGESEDEHMYNDGPMSYRDAADHIQWNYMLRLKEAPFKIADANLLPSAGACTTCLKRTGNQPELFEDVKVADTCTDPPCFAAKRDAHLEALRQGAIAKGKEVVAANARGYVKLDEPVRGDYQGRTYRQILGKSAPAPVLMPAAHDDKAKLVEVVKKADVKDVVAQKLAKQRSTSGGGAPARDWEREREEKQAYQKALFTHVCAKLPTKIGRDELRLLVDDILDDVDVELLEELFIPKPAKGAAPRLIEVLDKLDSDALGRPLVAATLSLDVDGYSNGDRLTEVAKLYKIDAAAIKKSTKAAIKAATQPAEAVEA